jgi:hypothetical protein
MGVVSMGLLVQKARAIRPVSRLFTIEGVVPVEVLGASVTG